MSDVCVVTGGGSGMGLSAALQMRYCCNNQSLAFIG